MLDSKTTHQGFRSVEYRLASIADSGRELPVSLSVQEQARAAMARAQEDAAIGAQDVLSQADEALVMG